MDKVEKATRLKKLLEQIAPGKSIESISTSTPAAMGRLVAGWRTWSYRSIP